MKTTKYRCPKCGAVQVLLGPTNAETIKCRRCQTEFAAATARYAGMTIHQKQQCCLWIGVVIMDVTGLAFLSHVRFKWYPYRDIILLLFLIVVSTATICYSSSLEHNKSKDA
jgi:hypothetical protein